MTSLWDAPEPALVATYVDRARALAPLIEAAADQTEQERCLPDQVVSALHDAGLYRLLLPRGLGGAEVDPVTFVRVIEEIAKADASTAWCLCQASGCSMSAAYLAPDVAKQIFGDDPRAVLAWGPGPDARATPVDGGYRLSGTWSFASGCRQANWLGSYAPIVGPDGKTRRRPDGGVDARTMLFPASSATIIDVWNVSGLRGTASDAFTVSDLFVPHERSMLRDDPAERQVPGTLYCFPLGSLYASGFAGLALGVARASLDALVDLAGEKTVRGGKSPLRDSGVVQFQVGRAEGQLRSARALLLGSLADIWAAVGRSGVLTLDQRMLIRLAATYAIHEAKEVVDAAHHAAGASAIFTASAFDRRFRDMHAVTQQLQGRQAHFETVGQFVLGLSPDTTFL
jgi:alkylation response protein AidB-like acyl-CoA dehydrogenase